MLPFSQMKLLLPTAVLLASAGLMPAAKNLEVYFIDVEGGQSTLFVSPGGESMLEIQARVVAEMLRLRERHRGECVALVSHGDVIRAAVAYFLGVPLDFILRFEISLASISVIAIGDGGPWVLGVNNTGDELLPFPP